MNLVEAAAEASEDLMEKYLGGEELTEEEIEKALRQRVLNNEIILVAALRSRTRAYRQCWMPLLTICRLRPT
ncbi:hypothetical protein ACLK12_17820 [Escherichia coli]